MVSESGTCSNTLHIGNRQASCQYSCPHLHYTDHHHHHHHTVTGTGNFGFKIETSATVLHLMDWHSS
ncbi:hypothetical protein E2C01_000700 [Portunus trituberculatus]|uniref:Uncharacterized protein n=1 Tax=Portunus trituberculatus TaxID=210409 RepID=A0A5B7CFR7_PORTR|nr:hypothetical protein [Portunus trituberculatus]